MNVYEGLTSIAMVVCAIPTLAFSTPQLHIHTLTPSIAAAERIFEDAAKISNLESPEVQPWHIRATYQSFNEQGEPKEAGTYEEFWVSGKHYRRSYTTPSLKQTDYASEQGILRDGDQRWTGQGEMMVRRSLVNPLPLQELANATPELGDKKFGQLKLRCVTLTHLVPAMASVSPPVNPAYCFDMDQPILRFESSYNNVYQTTFADPISFQGHSLAQSVQIDLRGKPFLKIHMEVLELLNPVNEADFVPPASARKLPPLKIMISSGVAAANLINKADPVYPDEAKARRIEGTVVLGATIDPEGHVTQVRPVSSPDPSLTTAASEAVSRWVYKPYLLNGEAVAVDTQINVNFSLRR